MTARAILIADDHPLFREALKLAIAKTGRSHRTLEAASIQEALSASQSEGDLALVLLDLRMPDSQGFSGLAQLHAEHPQTPILVVTGAVQANAPALAQQYGAVGFVSKSEPLEEIAARIDAALSGQVEKLPTAEVDPVLQDISARIASLTPTQLKVLLGVLAGKLNKQIAFEQQIAEATVKAHMTAILRKLNVFNRTQAALAVRALELEPDPTL